jgi:hypothetical protein
MTGMPAMLAVFKSAGDPLMNVAGAYFPAWLACMIAGALGTWLAGAWCSRKGWGILFRPAALMVPAIFIGLTCALWLVFFAAR